MTTSDRSAHIFGHEESDATDGVDPTVGAHADDSGATTYFEGDIGKLPLAARRALVLLLKRTHVTAITHPREWQAILEHRRRITSRLNDMFLELAVDLTREVAYKRQAGQDHTQSFPTLLANRTYTRDEVALLLHARGAHERAAQAADEDAYIERAELLEAVGYIRPRHDKPGVRADDKAGRAIDRLRDDHILISTEDPDRFQISPVVKTVITVERLPQFLEALTDANSDDGPDSLTIEPDDDRANEQTLDEALDLGDGDD